MQQAESLIGTWELRSFVLENDAGDEREPPWGPESIGLLIYTADGSMAVNLMSAQRELFGVESPFAQSQPEERAAAAASALSYSGTYERQGDMVIHHILVSSFPNYVGKAQKRQMQLEGDTLTLRSNPLYVQDIRWRPKLVWQRKK